MTPPRLYAYNAPFIGITGHRLLWPTKARCISFPPRPAPARPAWWRRISVSHTTRAMRPGEEDGVNYHFTDRDTFVRQVEQGRFLEHAEVFGNLYGTSADWVAQTLRSGDDVILEIDWQGATQIRKQLPDSVSIFILPPSLETLAERLRGRETDDESVIQQRLDGAQEEMSHYGEFDYLVVNDDFQRALYELEAILEARRLITSRQSARLAATLSNLLGKR